MVELVNLYHIQYYSLPKLEMEYEVFCAKTVTAYARIDSVVFLGYEDGSLEAVEVKVVNTKESYNRVPSNCYKFYSKQLLCDLNFFLFF